MTAARQFGGKDMVVLVVGVSLGLAYAAAYKPILAIVAMVFVVFAAWVLTRPDLVLYVVVAAMPWNGMLEFPSPTLSLNKALGLALAVSYLLWALRRNEPLRFPPVLGIAALFGFVVGLSLLFAHDPAGGLTKALRYASFFLILFLAIQLIQDRKTLMRVLRVLTAATALAAAYGLVQFLSGAAERASGPIPDPNDFAYMMATVIPIALFLAREDRGRRLLWGIATLLLFGAILATLSRGALVGLAVLLLWAVVTRRIGFAGTISLILSSLVLIGLALTLWSSVINERLEEKSRIGAANVESRAAFWSAAERMAMDHPILGVGPGAFSTEAKNYVRNSPIALENPLVHNSYLEILAEDGPFALLLFLGMLAAAWIAATGAERMARIHRDKETRALASAVKGMLLVATVSGIFLSEQVSPPFWVAAALAAVLAVPAHGEGVVELPRLRRAPASATA
ncbi:MAG TPA: O-antigen ligase family protein [Solirubrobacterales bacterium]|nr:O-antigen ligase family protein [Solirubrobacterales bacterium]